MDTVEELNGTYFYAGRINLSASELFFMIFCEQVSDQLGISDVSAVVAIVSGINFINTRTKPNPAIKGTSPASKMARKVFGKAKFPLGIKMPTLVGGYPPSTLKVRMVRKIGTFVGRAIPVAGWVLIAKDVSDITYHTLSRYNKIARKEDKLW